VAVGAFLDRRIRWVEIAEVVDEVLQQGAGNADTVEDVLAADDLARTRARSAVQRRQRSSG
jgi:1-deoxy-D-xylulose 5-phosphate reductoisomerase